MTIIKTMGASALVIAAALQLSGCASIQSTDDSSPKSGSAGLIYYMPKRDILVSITAPKAEKPAAADSGDSTNHDAPAKSTKTIGQTKVTTVTSKGRSVTTSLTTTETTTPAQKDLSSSESGSAGDANGKAATDGKPDSSGTSDTSSAQIVAVGTGTAYPDLSKRYLLTYQGNPVGKNHLSVKISESGLLGETGSETTSGVNAMLVSLATTAGSLRGQASFFAAAPQRTPGAAPVTPPCTPQQTYTLLIDPATPIKNPGGKQAPAYAPKAFFAGEACGFDVFVERLFVPNDATAESSSKSAGSTTGTTPSPSTNDEPALRTSASMGSGNHAGLYYRESLPYRVYVVQSDAVNNHRDFLVFSPNEAPTAFLPQARTLFADNNATFTFKDGMPQSFDQSADGELVALAKLPADILEAYFTAIGSAFSNRKTDIDNEKDYLDALNQLAVTQIKRAKCQDAIDQQKSRDDIITACSATD